MSMGAARTVWLGHAERGTVFSLKLIGAIGRLLGRPLTRLLLHPIIGYFLLFAPRGRVASRSYLTRVFGRPARWAEVYRHHLTFATVLLDRVYLSGGHGRGFRYDSTGHAQIHALISAGQGCLLLGAHLGSFDAARIFGEQRVPTRFHMMMYEANARKLKAAMEGLGLRDQVHVLPIGEADSLLRARDALASGECVGILADRALTDLNPADRHLAVPDIVTVPFLGAPARFPAGPFIAASLLGAPVFFFSCLYLGGNRYRGCFHLLAERIEIRRTHRAEDLHKWVALYAARLEAACRQAPYNWFNFYPFWQAS